MIKKVWYAFYLCHRKFRPMTQKTLRGIALRQSGRVSLKRPAAGGESCEQDSILRCKKEKALKTTYTMLFLRLSPLPRSAGCGTWTRTVSLPMDFESTSSAIPTSRLLNCMKLSYNIDYSSIGWWFWQVFLWISVKILRKGFFLEIHLFLVYDRSTSMKEKYS